MAEDSYLTISGEAVSASRERSSKFIAFAFPVTTEEEIKSHLDALRKEYYDATHHCYAWRLGASADRERANDDGEPSGTAGKPILGQMLSAGITNTLIVVVRYFGGTKLGVSGLISAYRDAAAEVIGECEIVERTVDAVLQVDFSYMEMNDVMRVVKDLQPQITSQNFDNLCSMELQIRRSMEPQLVDRLGKIEGVRTEFKEYK